MYVYVCVCVYVYVYVYIYIYNLTHFVSRLRLPDRHVPPSGTPCALRAVNDNDFTGGVGALGKLTNLQTLCVVERGSRVL